MACATEGKIVEAGDYAPEEAERVEADVEPNADHVEQIEADGESGTSGRARRPVIPARPLSESNRRATLSPKKAGTQRQPLRLRRAGRADRDDAEEVREAEGGQELLG